MNVRSNLNFEFLNFVLNALIMVIIWDDMENFCNVSEVTKN
jgi:hypothetical protein